MRNPLLKLTRLQPHTCPKELNGENPGGPNLFLSAVRSNRRSARLARAVSQSNRETTSLPRLPKLFTKGGVEALCT